MWTCFMDMHSGGGTKELPYEYIFIEAPEDEAKRIFYARFDHNPERVTCTCCGEDYSISSHESLAQLTGYYRNCRTLETPRDPSTKLYKNDDPVIKAGCYLEENDPIPAGYGLSRRGSYGKYQRLDDYLKNKNVLVIRETEIKPEWRTADVPSQGYVWID